LRFQKLIRASPPSPAKRCEEGRHPSVAASREERSIEDRPDREARPRGQKDRLTTNGRSSSPGTRRKGAPGCNGRKEIPRVPTKGPASFHMQRGFGPPPARERLQRRKSRPFWSPQQPAHLLAFVKSAAAPQISSSLLLGVEREFPALLRCHFSPFHLSPFPSIRFVQMKPIETLIP
jgi:hypothetical protein